MPFPPRRGSDRAEDGGRPIALEDVTEAEIVGDLVDPDRLARGLSPGWRVIADVAPFDDEPLVEVLRVRRGPRDPELNLKPVESTDPDGPIACYERRPDSRRDHVGTSGSLEAAVRAATNWVHQRTG
jgi:hypothetical protein